MEKIDHVKTTIIDKYESQKTWNEAHKTYRDKTNET